MGMDLVCQAYGIPLPNITLARDGIRLRGAYVSYQQLQRVPIKTLVLVWVLSWLMQQPWKKLMKMSTSCGRRPPGT